MVEESVSSSPTFWAALFTWFTPTVFFVLLQLVIATIYITSTLSNNHKLQHQHQQQQHQDPQQQHEQQQHARSPSVLQRLKSINYYSPYSYRSQDPFNQNTQDFQTHEQQQQQQQQQQQLLRSPSLLQRFKSINLYSYFPTEPLSSNLTTTHHTNETITSEPEKQLQQDVVQTYEEEDDDVVVKLFHHEEGGDGGGFSPEQDDGYIKRTQSDTKPTAGELTVKLPKKMKKSASSKSAFSHFKEDEGVESRRPATVKEKKVSGSTEEDVEVDAKADDFINKFKQQLKLQRLDSIMRKEVIGE